MSITISKTKLFVAAAIAAIVGLGATNLLTALDASDARAAHRDQIHDVRQAHADEIRRLERNAAAVKAAAVETERERGATQLRRTVKRMKGRAERAATEAREQGYASGNSAGYSSGHSDGETEGYADGSSDGFDDGLDAGSDELECSDDMDVYWLPACF